MTEFWEEAFADKQEMWGFEPSRSAILAKDFFVEKSVKKVLIPGIGYDDYISRICNRYAI